MNFLRITEAVEAAADASDDPAVKTRVLVLYIAPEGGLFIHRVGIGSHLLGADANETFSTSMNRAVEKLWPEASAELRNWMRIAAHAIQRLPLARMMMGRASDDEN